MVQKELAIEIIKRLRDNGYTAFLAGGCVRDMLLGKQAKDYDVATNACPENVTMLFKRTLQIGAKFGVVVVLSHGVQVEVATFRTETGYVDGRHPGSVAFADAKEDASRRDFTINGIFYDPIENRLIDYVGGQEDLELGRIRTIGDAKKRFGEDYLRMLRAVRFSTRLRFAIEEKTWQAIIDGAENITRISGERIAMELEAILAHPNRQQGAKMLYESGLLRRIFPQLNNDQVQFGIGVLGKIRKSVDFALALGALLCKCTADSAIDQLSVLKLSNDQIKHVHFLLSNRSKLLNGDMPVAQLRLMLAQPYFRDLFELERAIQRYTKGPIIGLTRIKKRARALAGTELTPKPLLNGHQIIALGAIPGPQVGEVAEEMYIEQLNGKLTTAEQASAWVKNWLNSHYLQ